MTFIIDTQISIFFSRIVANQIQFYILLLIMFGVSTFR